MKHALVLFLICLLAPSAFSQLRPFGDAFALKGARIEIGDGKIIEKGDILIRDGLIEAIGPDLKIPPDAEVIKADGLVAYPGFIDLWVTKGIKAPDSQADQDTPPNTSAEASPSMRVANRRGVRADLHANAYLALADPDLQSSRKAGFTTALIAPTGGLINGWAALVNLSGAPKRDSILLPDAALCMGLKIRGAAPFGGGYPGTMLGNFAQIRQTFYDAGYLGRVRSAFNNGGSRRPPDDAVLTSIRPVLEQKGSVIVEADRESDVVSALNLARDFHLHACLVGGAEAWKQAARLAEMKIPVLLSLKLPDEPKLKSAEPQKQGDKPPGKPGASVGDAPKQPAAAESSGQKPDGSAKPEKPTEPEEDPDADVPETAKVERHRLWAEKLANAKSLHAAGVTIALTSQGVKDHKEFWENLRKVVKDGLPRDAALRALTANPARIMGMERQLGTLQPGRIANITIMSADFLEPKAEPRYLFIDGAKFDLKVEKPGPAPANPFGTEATREVGR